MDSRSECFIHQYALNELVKLAQETDHEEAHVEADLILLRFLTALGYADIVAAWEKITPKWYA